MKTTALAVTIAALGLAACATSAPGNSKPYACSEYNKVRAEITANPAAVSRADTLKFLKVNNVGFKTLIGKHPSKDDVLRTIDDSVDLHALQCRLAPDATIHYTAENVAPGSVRLGYVVTYPNGEPDEVTKARFAMKTEKPITNEAGMKPVKEYIQNCAAGSAPAHACRLSGL